MTQIKIKRQAGIVIMDEDDYNRVIEDGLYITVNRCGGKGTYFQAMVCKKGPKGVLAFRKTLSRYVMKFPQGKHVDHIDGDPLNNVRSNLRLATTSENGGNQTNRKPTRGITKQTKAPKKCKPDTKYFSVSIKHMHNLYRVTGIQTEKEAIEIRDKLGVFLFGDFWPQYQTTEEDVTLLSPRIFSSRASVARE